MSLFSKEELKDIIISVFAITIIFAYPNLNLFPFYFLIVVSAFLSHELMHRFVARKFNCVAFYKMWIEGIIFGLLFMIVGIKFVAPGAVIIYPYQFGRWGFRVTHLTMTEMGIISVSGIFINIFFAIIFKSFSGAVIFQGMDLFASMSFVNAWLALFNLIPIPPLDGSKIFKWKPLLWFFLLFVTVLLIFL